jgi:hypothetical protein
VKFISVALPPGGGSDISVGAEDVMLLDILRAKRGQGVISQTDSAMSGRLRGAESTERCYFGNSGDPLIADFRTLIGVNSLRASGEGLKLWSLS